MTKSMDDFYDSLNLFDLASILQRMKGDSFDFEIEVKGETFKISSINVFDGKIIISAKEEHQL